MIGLSGNKNSLSDYIFDDGLAPSVGLCGKKRFLRSESQSTGSSRCAPVWLQYLFLPEMQGKCSKNRSHPCHFSILKGLSHLSQLQGDILGNSRKAWSLVARCLGDPA